MGQNIRFEKHIQKSSFHNPMMNNQIDTQALEIRKDPLTGAQSVFNPRLEDKVAMFYGKSDTALIQKMAEEGRSHCFLCEDRWKQATPTYPAELVAEGRIRVGQAVLFPNIFPAAQVHAVIRVGEKHYVPLSEFDARDVADGFSACLELAKRLAAAHAGADHLTINGNYLQPAGASIAHPHFQMVGGDLPFSYLEKITDLSRSYFKANQTCYFNDLLDTEKTAGERYIGATGPVAWITAFSPSGTNEVMGILPQKSHFLEMDAEDVTGLAQGFAAVMRGYADLDISTFNFAVYSAALGKPEKAFRCFIRIISRQNVYENYRTDDYFLQKLLDNELILTPPEALAKTMRQAFKR
jgi:UDPglucose--hexose-1-phosphate uridylyltransferase